LKFIFTGRLNRLFIREVINLEPRVDYYKVVPEALKIMMEMEKYTKTTGIDRNLRELIKIRASQINGCAYCLNMHTTDARKMGETEQRLYCISAWRECTFYTDAEKVALELTEHVTLIPTKRVPDELYNRVRQHYDERQYVDLVFIINQINNWNRISISMGNIATEK
jgi:AhpD family alkylhydroperoxidase